MIITLFMKLSFDCLCACDYSGEKQEEGKYKHTVDLPKTTFGMRANALVREPEIQKLWDDHQVFKRVADKNDGVNIIAIIVPCFMFMRLFANF